MAWLFFARTIELTISNNFHYSTLKVKYVILLRPARFVIFPLCECPIVPLYAHTSHHLAISTTYSTISFHSNYDVTGSATFTSSLCLGDAQT